MCHLVPCHLVPWAFLVSPFLSEKKRNYWLKLYNVSPVTVNRDLLPFHLLAFGLCRKLLSSRFANLRPRILHVLHDGEP